MKKDDKISFKHATFYRMKNAGASCPANSVNESLNWLSLKISEQNAQIVVRDLGGHEIIRDQVTNKRHLSEIFEIKNINNNNPNNITIMDNLSEQEKAFLTMSEKDVLCIAANIKQIALANKDIEDGEFLRAILEPTDGAVTFTKHPNGKQVSFAKCKLFRMTHAKKHPGRISYQKIDETIINIHKRARVAVDIRQDEKEESTPTTKGCKKSMTSDRKRTAKELIDKIINTIIVHKNADAELRCYFKEKDCSLANDLAMLTNGVISCKIEKSNIILTNIVGRQKTIEIGNNMSKDTVKALLHTGIVKLIISATLSSSSREAVNEVIDVDTVEALIFDENEPYHGATYREEMNNDASSSDNEGACSPNEVGHSPRNAESSSDPSNSINKVKVFTAFSGYDSQCMALEKLKATHPGFNYELVGWSEIDKKAIASHNAVFPEYAECFKGDISKIDWKTVSDFDLFTYSSPCQSFSSAGKREGGEKGSGTTSSLLWECQRAIEEKRPKFCILENVKGLVDKTMYHTLEDWQLTLCKMGYVNYWQVLDAGDYGVPQHRERIFMISIRIDNWEQIPEYSFPAPTSCDIRPEELLDEDVDEKYYLSANETKTFVDILKNAAPGYETNTNFRKHRKEKVSIKGKCQNKFVTPLCSDGTIPTVTASGIGTITTMYSTGDRPCAGVLEVRKSNNNKKN